MLKSVCMYSLEELENYRKARPSVLFEKGFEEGKDGPSKVGEGSVVTGTTLIRKSTIVSGASTLRSRGSDIRSIELRDKGKEREVEAEVIADRRVVSEPLSSLLPKFDFQRLNSGGMTQATSRTEADASARLPIDRTEDVIFPPRPSTPQPKLRKENEIISPSRNRGDVTQSSIPLAPLPGNQLRGVRSSARISSKTYRRSITIKPFPPEEYVINLYKQAFESKSIGNYPKAQTEFALCAKSILKLPEHPIYSRMNIVKLNRMLRECLSAVTALESLQSPNVVDQPSSPRATKRVADQAFRGCMLWYEDGIKHQTRDPSRAKKSFAKSVKMILAMPAHPCYSMMDQRLLSETAIACNEFLENRREGEKRKEATCVKRRSNAVYIKTPAARPTASARLAPEKPRVAAVERPEIRSAPLAKNVKPIASWPATSKRKLVIPEAVYEAFYNLGIVLPPLILAYNDINADVQTCGVLCGVWFDVKQALVITHILVPKQVKTKHSCIIREGDSDGLVEYQKRFNLLTLGWYVSICFLSLGSKRIPPSLPNYPVSTSTSSLDIKASCLNPS